MPRTSTGAGRAPRVRVEFTVEPFREGQLGSHVSAALRSLRRGGFDPDVGPFGSTVEGDAGAVLDAVAQAAAASFESGASGVSLHAVLLAEPDREAAADDVELDDFLAAMRPVARALGGSLVPPERMSHAAVPLHWKGRLVAGLERPGPSDLRDGLAKLVAEIEGELGGRLAELSRTHKQRAVRLLDERGAFAIRNAVDEVADAMGVSRVTVYNYLNATRTSHVR
jgi:uncharacterized protein YqgV (UPF0045/DUF77 family)